MGRAHDLTGQKFGWLTGLHRHEKNTAAGKPRWVVRCACGNVVVIEARNLKSGHAQSCGCRDRNFIDLTGKRFNRLVVNGIHRYNGKQGVWHCLCDCGNEITASPHGLHSGKRKSCGCLQQEYLASGIAGRNRLIDLTGKRFHRLSVLRRLPANTEETRKNVHWFCICDCGNFHSARGSHLSSGNVQSCGCWRHDACVTHGLYRQELPITNAQRSTFNSYIAMLRRCYKRDDKDYPEWGGRGITVCDKWLGPEGFYRFLADMGLKPEGLTIDRRNNDKGYTPRNCRWTDKPMQNSNRRPARR